MGGDDAIHLVVGPGGHACLVYDDAFDARALGDVVIARASHVEPDAAGRWHADLSPVDGPVLGPFVRRREALAAERRWLVEHRLPSALSFEPRTRSLGETRGEVDPD